MRVLAALSGGVDSAVAASRAVAQGHDVVGVHLALSESPMSFRSGARGCCSLEDSRDARRVADVLGVPFYVWDLAEQFRTDVVDDFVAEYAAGRTPNPCIRCNERIKFLAVLERALALGFDAVCTGHYARLVDGPAGPELHRGADEAKDQSYVLAALGPSRLGHVLFPLGPSRKSEVRQEAASLGLLVADKPDSHDICFIADGDTRGFLERRLGARPGAVVDERGRRLADHDGAWGVTVGQRRGLGVTVPAPDGSPRYVLGIEPTSRTVTVGPRSQLSVDTVVGSEVTWCGPAVRGTHRLAVQWRAHGDAVDADVTVGRGGTGVSARLLEPAEAVAPGQALVLYDGSRVVGSATVTAARRSEAPAGAGAP
jgi:tRNA-specific 2-thiouridylase